MATIRGEAKVSFELDVDVDPYELASEALDNVELPYGLTIEDITSAELS